MAGIRSSSNGPSLSLAERFQGANISAFHEHPNHAGERLDYYETDSAMYSGSSGCPDFLTGGEVFAIYVASVVAEDSSNGGPRTNGTPAVDRVAISIWVAAREIEVFANANGLDLV